MCLFFSIAFLGPRFGLLVYWIGWPTRWELAFDSFIVPFLGFLVAPWTTLAWVIVAPSGVVGFDYFLLGLAVLADISSLAGSGRQYQTRRTMSPAY